MKTTRKSLSLMIVIFSLFVLTNCSEKIEDGGLRIGWAIEDITPDGPASLAGQYYERISEYVQSPLKATAMAIESVDENGNTEQAIMVSLDLVNTKKLLQTELRDRVKEQLEDFDVKNLFINVTHTHSAPDHRNEEYRPFLLDQLTKVVISAWENRKPAAVSNALGYAVVGHSRRVMYSDGTTEMYGLTSREDFIGMEGPSDPGVDMLFCWDLNKNLTGIVMNVSCPAQVTEAKYYISSDYWSEVRKQVKNKYGEDIYVLPQIGAAGDISPRDLPRGYKAGEPNMWDVEGIVEIGKRLIHVVDQAYPDAKMSIQSDVTFKHLVEDIELPARIITEKEYKDALAMVNEIMSREPDDPESPETAWNRFLKEIEENEKIKEYGPWDDKESDFGWLRPCQSIVSRYEKQTKEQTYCDVELHVLRLGDVVFANNPFELYVDYGFMITGRSPASQTFLIQLSGDAMSYLPTQRAVQGGGYSAMLTTVGPEGGKELVEKTLELINEAWSEK